MTYELWMLLATLGVNLTTVGALIKFRVSLENRLTRMETIMQFNPHQTQRKT